MRVAKIRIHNVMGLDLLEIDNPGSLTTLEARNGEGKTSAIEAIRSIIEGGHDGTLLRNGADSGEVVIILDDDTEITKRITAEKSDLTVRRPDVGSVSSPKKYVERLFNALSVNPIAFLMLPEKDQAQALLEALPLELDRAAVGKAINGVIPLRDSDFRGHALDVLAGIHKRIYDERTGVNRAGKEKKGSIDQLSASIVDGDDEDPTDEIAALEAERDSIPGNTNDQVDRLEDDAGREVDAIETPYLQQIGELQGRIDQLKAEMAKKTREISARHAAAVKDLRENERLRMLEIRLRLDALRNEQQARAAAENTRLVVQRFTAEHTTLVEKSQALTAALAKVDALKMSLAKSLPIKGIEVRDGMIYKGDVPFRRLNKAEQVKVAIRLAQLRAGDVPLVCVDGIEVLDAPTFEAFRANAAKTDLQFIVTRVSPDLKAPPGLTVRRGMAEEEAVPA